MMLVEEGRLLLSDPLPKYIAEFAGPKVAVERGGKVEIVSSDREITVQDLLRHTSGMTYEFTGISAVQKMYMDAKIFRRNQTNSGHAALLATLPLMHQPGARWEYSRSTDILGRVIEVISGQSLGAFLKARITKPLGMADTDFFVERHNHDRIAEPFSNDPDSGASVQLLPVRDKPAFESGGGGLVSTATDYARFCQMLLDRGRFGTARLLGPKTVEYMTADHLDGIPANSDLLPAGHGFGLGFSIRTAAGMATMPGSVGSYSWGGLAGTTFWIDPHERLFAVLLIQAPGRRDYFRTLFRNLVYAAVET